MDRIPMTMTQKILAAAAGLDYVEAGQLIEADLDLVLGNDITSPVAIKEMEKMNVDGVFNKDKIALVPDHFVPNKDIKSAEHCKCVREFAYRNEITNYFEVGEMGIEKQFDSMLKGTDGYIKYQKDLKGYKIAGTPSVKEDAIQGKDIYLKMIYYGMCM